MKKDMQINLNVSGFQIDEMTRFKIMKNLETDIAFFPNHSTVEILILKQDEHKWEFDISMRYLRGHVATTQTATTFSDVIAKGLAEFRRNLQIHEIQASVETFHFDKSAEYDFYTEVSTEGLSIPARKLSTLIVEDDPAAAVVLKTTLSAIGCNVDHFDLPGLALEAIISKRYDLLVLDWNLPYMKGSDFFNSGR